MRSFFCTCSPRPSCAILAVAVASSVVACHTEDAADEATAQDLVGGSQAAANQFPSTMQIFSNCTVSKVGPRHILTAAHCVTSTSQSGTVAPFNPGDTIFVTSAVDVFTPLEPSTSGPQPTPFTALRVKETHVAPAWEAAPVALVRVLGSDVPADAAIIEIDLEGSSADAAAAFNAIPAASIDLNPIATREPLVIMGYGCEHGVAGAMDFSHSRLKFHQTQSIGPEALLHPGSEVRSLSDPFTTNLVKQYLFTPGNGQTTEEASICPGDSGGPVYRDDGKFETIVGLNAYYSFRPTTTDPSNTSVTNWHTRLDRDSRHDTGAWLKSLGVNVVGDTKSTHFSDCSSNDVARPVCGAFAAHVTANGGVTRFGHPTTTPRLELTGNQWVWTQTFASATLQAQGPAGGELVTATPRTTANLCGPAKNGVFCGSSIGDEEPQSVVRCVSGAMTSRTFCSTPCQSNPPGIPDACLPEGFVERCAGQADGFLCGARLGDPDNRSLYSCVKGSTFRRIECSGGCAPQPTGGDHCARP